MIPATHPAVLPSELEHAPAERAQWPVETVEFWSGDNMIAKVTRDFKGGGYAVNVDGRLGSTKTLMSALYMALEMTGGLA